MVRVMERDNITVFRVGASQFKAAALLPFSPQLCPLNLPWYILFKRGCGQTLNCLLWFTKRTIFVRARQKLAIALIWRGSVSSERAKQSVGMVLFRRRTKLEPNDKLEHQKEWIWMILVRQSSAALHQSTMLLLGRSKEAKYLGED